MSELTLYQDSKIIPERNFIVESLSDYLSTLEDIVIEDFQYVKHSLDLTLKISKSQYFLEYDSNHNYNYIKIKNYDYLDVYYFIINKEWRAQDTVVLTLRMDVLNTFRYNTDYRISSLTKVLREHKDRFEYKTIGGIKKLYNKIDLYKEGINPLLYQNKSDILEDSTNNKWYLIYNKQAGGGVECLLAPKYSTSMKVQGAKTLTASDLPEQNKYYVFAYRYNIPNAYSIRIGDEVFRIDLKAEGGQDKHRVLIASTTDSVNLEVQVWDFSQNRGVPYDWTDTLRQTLTGNLTMAFLFDSNEEEEVGVFETDTIPSAISALDKNYTFNFGTTPTTINLNAFSSLDRTLSTLNKIIALPYFPTQLVYSEGEYIIGNEWQYDGDTGFLKLKDLDSRFSNEIQTSTEDFIKEKCIVENVTPATTQSRGVVSDSKLLNSEFYQAKFVYDSFTYLFELEKISTSNYYQHATDDFSFEFVMTTTINSKFLYKFYNPQEYPTEDFYNILPVARNNEMPIYNDDYLTYLRTAYRYDLKTLERNRATSIAGAGLSIGGGLAMTAIGALTANPVAVAGGLVSLTTGIASTLMNTIAGVNQQEQNLEAKKAQLNAQSFAVAGSDDIDLLEAYCDNRAYLMEYIPSPRMSQLLEDLFFYTGYICGEMKLPDTTSRCRFNFVQAELVLDGNTSNIPEYIKDEIKLKFKEGVTFLHKLQLQGGYWDFYQEMENWETSLLS